MMNPKMSSFTKNLLLAILGLFAISVIFSGLFSTNSEPQKLTLSALAEKVQSGQIKSISVNGESIEAVLTDGNKVTSKKEVEAGLTETLKNLGVSGEALQKVSLGVSEESGLSYWLGVTLPVVLPLLLIGLMFYFMLRQAKGGINQAFSFGRSNIKLSNLNKEKITFSDVAGLKEAKEELIEVVQFLKNPKKFLDIGARIPRGVLLVGRPGTGKTLLARAVSGEANVPFFHISASEFVEMFVGVGASRTRDAFMVAKKSAPAILFIDEIDAVGRQRGAGMGGGNDEREQTLNQILVELDGFDRDTQVIILAATNRPDILDPALLRPGRFDRHVILDLPDINDREAILKIHSRGKQLAKNIDFRKVAARTPGFSGADLANLMNEGALLAARQNQKVVEEKDFLESVEKVILGPERKSRAISVKEKEMTAYHEAGHALVAASIKDSDPVHKVSIISRGMAGGYTLKLPMEDQHLRTKSQFLGDLAMMLGGFVSEKLVFGDVSTGASNDLKEASAVARSLVTKYGMSEKMGPMTFGNTDEMVFLGREMTTERNYSEETSRRIDEEVSAFIARAHKAATKILTDKRKILDTIAKKLIEKETLEQEEFAALLKPFKIKPVEV
ncbi:MAG: ATP-dependent zinc metalloprotease FtsH [Candidatus Liptonbacteria bacterium]|nr:ATP-dependent zinc metalloprotease FtsH [Candidatus Liptonbacteria bacterium]